MIYRSSCSVSCSERSALVDPSATPSTEPSLILLSQPTNISPYLEVLRPLNCAAKDLDEAGGALSALGDLPVLLEILGPVNAAINHKAEAVKPAIVKVCE